MVIAFILLILVIVFVFYWKVQSVRSKCLDASLYCRRIDVRNKIRIAVLCNGAILMRPFNDGDMKKKWDLTLETFIGNNETVEDALLRMVSSLGEINIDDVRFCLKHRSKYVSGRGIVYLFVVHCSDDVINEWKGCEDCALWDVVSIEGKLGHGIFTDKFKEEYSHILFVLDIWQSVSEGKYGLPYVESENGEV